jgi:hypothetical protein
MSEKRKTIRYELPGDEAHSEYDSVTEHRAGNFEQSYATNSNPEKLQQTVLDPATFGTTVETVELQGTYWCLLTH